MQKTLKNTISAQGLGLHTGRNISVTLRPAPVDSGVTFRRVDLADAAAIRALPENVTSTTLATTLGRGENRVSTVEHLMAALSALGVDNLTVEADGPELPVFDGSADEWVRLIGEAGLADLSAPRRFLKVTRPYKITAGDKSIEVRPARQFSVEAHIDFGGAIGRHCFFYTDSEAAFVCEISRSRTFCRLQDVEMMHSQGLAKGGSLDNAVVVGDDGILNPGGLRYDDEFVRHKILDFIGDMAMAGNRIMGHFIIHKPGHELNRRFLASALAQPGLLEETGAEKHRPREAARRLISRLPLSLDDALAPVGL
jgi:UDP-3-O-[3-hydroxymyristoyl] N-acetylglucosamine deacetylase